MIIDSRSHVVFPVEQHLKVMADESIDKTVLFSTLVHPEKSANYNEYKQELSKLQKILSGEMNPIDSRKKAIEELKKTVDDHPDKFIGFGLCPMGMDISQTRNWINDFVIANAFRGIGELTFGEGQVQKTKNIFKSVDDYQNYPLWFHTLHPLTLKDIRELLKLAKKYPHVPVIFGHGGGSFWLHIIEDMVSLKNVYFDISASYTTHSIQVASELIPERTLFSVDMPYSTPGVMKKMVDESVKDPAVREMIFAQNIKRLLEI